jgi:integrase
MAKKLTPLSVENAKPGTTRRELADGGCSGLYLVIQPESGLKSWALRYRNSAGKSKKLTLGSAGALTLAAARAAAAAAQHEIDKGGDPASEKAAARAEKPAPAGDSIEAAVDRFVELHVRRKIRPRSAEQAEYVLRRLALPAWTGRTVTDIKRRDIIALVESVAAARPVTANRLLAWLSKFFNWLVARDVVAVSPCRGVERPYKETARDRILDDQEIAALWLTAGDPDLGIAGPFVKMLLATGARRSEIAGMRWGEINPETRVWTLPATRSKNKLAYDVPLSDQAWNIVEAQPRIGDYVFPASNGNGSIRSFDHLKEKIDAKLKLAKPWTFHDLRRTCASNLQKLGIRIEVIEAALNHQSGSFRGVAGIYLRHDYSDEKRDALQRWADYIETLAATGQPAKVVTLKSRRG